MKQKEVKCTLTLTKAMCTAYSEEHGIVETMVTIPATFKSEEGLEKAIRKELEHDGLSLVKVNEFHKIHGTYTMDIEKFISNSNYTEDEVEENVAVE